MKLRLVAAVTVVCCGVGLSLWLGSLPAVAGSPQLVAAGTAFAPVGMQEAEPDKPDEKYSYIGSKSCKMCHITQYKTWEKTKMAGALESLKPDVDVEMKKKHDLDPKKDYTKDESCLKCHVTGFGEKGGYAVPDDPADKKAAALAGIGCEACHGPGSDYSKFHKEIKKSKAKYKVEQMLAMGLKKFDKDMCVNCHNDKSPTADKENPFEFEKDKNEDTHEHKALKQREE